MNPYQPTTKNDSDDSPAAFNRTLLRRHIYSMLVAAIAIACLPRLLDTLDPTGSAANRFRELPFFNDSFGFAGGMLAIWAIHLLSVLRKCGK